MINCFIRSWAAGILVFTQCTNPMNLITTILVPNKYASLVSLVCIYVPMGLKGVCLWVLWPLHPIHSQTLSPQIQIGFWFNGPCIWYSFLGWKTIFQVLFFSTSFLLPSLSKLYNAVFPFERLGKREHVCESRGQLPCVGGWWDEGQRPNDFNTWQVCGSHYGHGVWRP